MAALISVVVPVRDGERFLAAALDSVIAQEHRPLELIVIDDGSSDESAALARGYGEPVRVLRQPPLGPWVARNRGIAGASGELIAFLDADDLYRPGKLSRQLAELSDHPEADLCLCIAENFWEPGGEAERARYAASGKLSATHTLVTLLARREAFARVGLLSTARGSAAQADWFLRAADLDLGVRVLDEVLVSRRMHAASRSHDGRGADEHLALLAARIGRRRPSA